MTDFNPAEDEELVARIAALWMEANPGEFTDHEDAEYFARAELELGLPGIDSRDTLAVIARHFYEKGKADALEGALDAIDGLTRVPGAMLTPYEEGREEALQEAMSAVVELRPVSGESLKARNAMSKQKANPNLCKRASLREPAPESEEG